jgi:hypothetical protein
VHEISSNQEEADTKLLLHADHASSCGWRKFIIHTPDTDVFLIALSCLPVIAGNIFIKTGTRDKKRLVSLEALKESLESQIPDGLEYSVNDLLCALSGLHSFTGCDSVSAMAG